MTSPPARVAKVLKTSTEIVSLRNRIEPSQSRKLQPPRCRLQNPSAPDPGELGVLPVGTAPTTMSDVGPVRPKTMNMADAQVLTRQPSLVQSIQLVSGTPTQVASAT